MALDNVAPVVVEEETEEERKKRLKEEKRQARRKAMADPWTNSNALWVVLQVIVVWTVACAVLLAIDLGEDSEKAEVWLLGLIAVPWLLFLARYLMICISPDDSDGPKELAPVELELWRQSFTMASFAMERAKTPDVHALETVQKYGQNWGDEEDEQRLAALAKAHKHLSRLVAPAIPKTIVLISNFELELDLEAADDAASTTTKRKRVPSFSWLGNVRVARMMLGLALALLPIFIALALYKGTTLDSATDLFTGSFLDKFATAAYLIVASALGASFAALFKVRRYVEHLNYDDQYESSYWVRFVLGLVAGLILSVLLASLVPPNEEAQFRITVPLLALVGGFSSDLVYRILKRLIDAIETLIEGSASEIVAAEKQKSEARLREQEVEAQQLLDDEIRKGKQEELAALIAMMQELPAGAVGDAARAKMGERLVALVSSPNGGSVEVLPGQEDEDDEEEVEDVEDVAEGADDTAVAVPVPVKGADVAPAAAGEGGDPAGDDEKREEE